jgi:prephenate dehydrogenase
MIGFTSQLTHAIAVALVNSDTEDDTINFIGDSYRDLTRIAKINKDLWSELFFSNKDYLINELDNFVTELEKIRTALDTNDEELLKEQFVSAKLIREKMEK